MRLKVRRRQINLLLAGIKKVEDLLTKIKIDEDRIYRYHRSGSEEDNDHAQWLEEYLRINEKDELDEVKKAFNDLAEILKFTDVMTKAEKRYWDSVREKNNEEEQDEN